MSSPPPAEIPSDSPEQPQPQAAAEPLRVRYRVRFAKTGLLRWTSHRDLARLWERLVRRAQLQLSMTEGFHPKPRIGFPSALALGISGIDEVVELDLAEKLTAPELLERLAGDHQPGLQIKSVQQLPEGSGKAKLQRTDYVVTTPDPELGAAAVDEEALSVRMRQLLAEPTVTVERKKKTLTFVPAEQILSIRFADQQILLSMAASDAATLKPTDVLDLIGCSDWIANGSHITRTEVVLKLEFETADPELLANANQPPPDGASTQEVSQ